MTKTLIADETELLAEKPDQDKTLDHACLVAEYLSYMVAAGYSTGHYMVDYRARSAWNFLRRFPIPEQWSNLPLEQQLSCRPGERTFLHYLLLRHLIPIPTIYILIGYHKLGDMAIRLMERETYQRYQRIASRLGYSESGIRRQFQSLLCLMVWTHKGIDALTLDDLEAFANVLKSACRSLNGRLRRAHVKDGLPYAWYGQLLGMRNVLYHLGIFPQRSMIGHRGLSFEKEWQQIPPNISDTVRRYLQQLSLSLRSSTLRQERIRLYHFFSWLAETMPEITTISQIKRRHIEAFKEYLRWLHPHPRFHRPQGSTLRPSTRYKILSALHYFIKRISDWEWPEVPDRPLIFDKDLPLLEQPLPRFLEEVEAARFLETAREHHDLFTRVCGVTLILTGLRNSEFLSLTTDCIVQIGESYWLRVPIGKTRRDRFIPLHPEVKQLLDEWTAVHPPQKPYDFLFTRYGRRIGRGKVALAVERIAREASISGKVSPHRLRHTLATLAINRGMPLESIAALLGHRSLSMTLVYARIGNRTVQQEYASVSRQLEQLCNQVQLIDGQQGASVNLVAEGDQMRRLRQEHWRMLGNGYCTRPEGVPCEYETICESCPCFSTTVEFLPTLYKQKQDAEDKGQVQRVDVFTQLIQSMKQAPAEGRTIPY